MTKAEAKELCIKKWKWIVKHDGEMDYDLFEKENPDLIKLEAYCGYCEFTKPDDDCLRCPIYKKFGEKEICGVGSTYGKWNIKRTKYLAQKMLDLIKAT